MELVAIFIILLALSIAGAIIGSVISIIIFLSKKRTVPITPLILSEGYLELFRW
jgi:hypothetical protein